MTASRIELMAGEQMIVHANPHWLYFWKQLAEGFGAAVLALLAIAFGGALGTLFWWLAIVAFVGFILHLVYEFMQVRNPATT